MNSVKSTMVNAMWDGCVKVFASSTSQVDAKAMSYVERYFTTIRAQSQEQVRDRVWQAVVRNINEKC